jgi:hypothetical protein
VVNRERFYQGREGVDLAGMKVGGHTLLTGGLRYGKETASMSISVWLFLFQPTRSHGAIHPLGII